MKMIDLILSPGYGLRVAALLVWMIMMHGSVGADPGTTAANFLKLPQGNRATAMGNSFTAFAEGPTALHWNPAGLAKGAFNEIRLVYNDWIEGIYYGYAAYRHKLGAGGFGTSVTYLNSGKITKRGSGREDAGSTYYLRDFAVLVGQGLKVSEVINLGMSLEFISETADGSSFTGLAAGAGVQYRKNIKDHSLNLGMSVLNVGTDMGKDQKFPLPAVVRVGVGDELMNGRLKGSVEMDYYWIESTINGGVGAEFRAMPYLDLRCGYRFGREDVSFPYGLTAGIGIKYVENVEYSFDYSISSIGDLGFVNRIGMGIKF